MHRVLFVMAGSIGAALITAACGSGSGYSGYGSTNSVGGSTTGSAAATVRIAGSKVGQILVDGAGRTIYLFEADNGAMSSCYGSCLSVWPALVTSGSPTAGPGVNAALLTTTKRRDGSLEVVYNGHPLYYFSGDKQPGDITGQGLSSFGADWYVLSPAGVKVSGG